MSFTVTGAIDIGGGDAPADVGVVGNVVRVRSVHGANVAGRTLLPEPVDYPIAEDGTFSVDVAALPEGHAYEWVFVLGGGRWASRARLTAPPTANAAYADLVDVTAPSLPGYAPPPWAAGVLEARDEVAEAAGAVATTADEVATARDDVMLAKQDVEAVVATNDGIMSTVAADPASAFSQQLSASIAGIAPAENLGQFEIQPIVAILHSWQASTQNTSPGGRHWERLAKRLGMGAATVKAISGRTIGDNAVLALSGPNAWVPRTRALVIGGCTINDLVRFAGSDAGRRAYIHAWRAFLSTYTANAAIAANTRSFVFSSGGWVRENVTGSASDTSGLVRNSTGGQQWHTETVGDFFDFTFSGPDADLHMVAKIAGSGLITVSDGATVLGTLDLRPTVAQEVPAIFRIRDRGAGTHTIRVTLTAGASMWVDSYRVPLPSAFAAPIAIYGEPPLLWANYGDQATYDALLTSFKSELEQICAEFPSVLYMDLDRPTWDRATMLTADGIHPNDKGAAWLATEEIKDLSTVPYSPGLNVTAATYPAIYTAPTGPAIPSGGKAGDYVAGVTLPVVDTFNRSDSTGTLGTTSDGTQLWGELGSPGITGAAGISSNRGYCSARAGSSGWYVRTLETGSTDHKAIGKLGSAPTLKHGLLFSIVDGSNLMYVYPESSSALTLGKRLGNTAQTVQSGIAVTLTSTSEITATVFGTTVTIRVDGVTVWTGPVSDRPMGTKVGFGVASSSGSFDGYWDQFSGDLASAA